MDNKDKPVTPILAHDYQQMGLTKREFFAAMAMSGVLADVDPGHHNNSTARYCVDMADALLEELER